MNDIISKEQAKKELLVEDGMVHTFHNMSFGLIGGDYDIKSVHKDIDNAYMIRRSGKQAQAMGHGLVIIPSKKCKQSDLLFLETKKKILEKKT